MDPTVIALLAAGVPLGVTLVVLLVYWMGLWGKKLNRVWAEAARRLGGTFDPKAGPWYRRSRLIRARVADVDVVVTHYVVSTGNSVIYYTRLRARSQGAVGFTLSIQPKGLLAKVGAAFGRQDIATGDAAFDEAFVVRSNNEDLARSWLDADVRKALLETKGYGFTLKNGELTVERAVLEDDADRIARAATATGMLAARGEQLRQFWRAVADRRGAHLEDRDDGGLRIAIDDLDVPVRVDTRSRGDEGRTLTRITARIIDASPERYELAMDGARSDDLVEVDGDRIDGLKGDYSLGSSDPDRTASRFGSEQRARIERLRPQRIEAADGEVRIDVSDVEGDEERLAEAMELATELAARQAKSAYRA